MRKKHHFYDDDDDEDSKAKSFKIGGKKGIKKAVNNLIPNASDDEDDSSEGSDSEDSGDEPATGGSLKDRLNAAKKMINSDPNMSKADKKKTFAATKAMLKKIGAP